VESTNRAVRGGVFKDRIHGDTTTFDPFTPNQRLNVVTGVVYSSLVKTKPYKGEGISEVGPDAIESWEWADDGLSVAMKMRPNVKFHNKPPVNGRTMDIQDVLFSWKRFEEKSTTRTSIANSAAPEAPVLSITSTDARTLVMKLKEPIPYALNLFTSNSTGGVVIMPKETDTSFDPRTDIIGTGPFYLSDYQPSVSFTFKRHPDYWDKDYAFVDQIDRPILSEYSAVLAQFKAGNLYTFGLGSSGDIQGSDVIPTKREHSEIQVYQGTGWDQAGLVARRLSFGWLPEGKSPFLDERVRQAISMSWDRDLYLETFFNVSTFQAEGLPMATRWNTHLLASDDGWWLDPQSKDFGPNAKYFEHNLPEAKKLLSAAGHPNGFDTVSNYVTTTELNQSPRHNEVMDGFMRELGIRITHNSINYVQEYQPNYRDGRGQYEGWAYVSATGAPTGGSSIVALANEYWAKGNAASFVGMSVNGRNDRSGDPQVDALVERGRLERDQEKQRQIVFELQRYLAKPWYAAHLPGMAAPFTVSWPVVGNFQVWRGARQGYQIWIDQTKPPIKSA
jgi:peptide/nickel transport system substrate-binding protein